MNLTRFFSVTVLLLLWSAIAGAADRYVSTTGSDGNPGTLAAPLRTINVAVTQSAAGDTVHVRGGVYSAERVVISGKNGTAALPITLSSFTGETAIIDGAGITPPNGDAGLVEIVNSSHVTVQGLEIRNFQTTNSAKVPIGIFVRGSGSGVRLVGNKVHDIWQSSTGAGDAYGIAVKGTAATAIDGIVIDGNEVYNLRTGSSESVVLNGNVTNFAVTNNIVHDCNNIGIDFIGYEGVNANSALDRARSGVCAGNTVYNIDTQFNPAYGGNFSGTFASQAARNATRAGPGIYVDGGADITIERNTVYACNIGVSIGSENSGRTSDSVRCRDNVIRHNHVGGVFVGGAGTGNGGTTNTSITHNTLYQNDTELYGGGCVAIQNFVSTTTIKNNIIFARSDGGGWGQFVLKGSSNGSFAANAIDWNIYSGTTLSGNLEFIWNGTGRSSFSSWRAASGQDANSSFTTAAIGFTNVAGNDFTLLSTSLARDVGDPAFVAGSGELDHGGLERVFGGRVDVGADEHGVTPPSNNANLSALLISAGTLTPAFAAGTMSYSAIVPEGTASLVVTPTAAESHAVIRVNGTVVASGTASGAIPLNVGSNNINVVVTAQDTVTVKTYALTITRPPGVVDIGLEQPAGSGVIDGSGTTSFGTVAIDATPVLTFTVRSNGTDPLTGLSVTKDGADASEFVIYTTTLPGTLAGGASATFTVTFTPQSTGAKNAAIHIASNDADENPFDIALSATAIDPRAQMITPVNGATLAGAATTFTWSAGTGVTSYALWIGNNAGAYDLYAANEGSNLSKTVTLPTDGRVVHVTLWSLINGVYKSAAYVYTTPRPVKARITSPANGSALGTNSLALTWDAGALVTQIVLWVGSTVDGYDLNNSIETDGARMVAVPVNGAKVYVTLWSLINGAYQGNRYVFTARSPVKATLSNPVNASTLSDATLALVWNAGVGVSKYVVWVGSAAGGYDIAAVDAGSATSRNIIVPQDGGPVYVTLWSLIGGAYQSESYWFTTALPVAGNVPARLTSPANTSTLATAAVDFTWDVGVGVTAYALWIGSAADGYDLHNSNGTATTRNVVLPADGRRVFVTLHSLIGGAWRSNSHWFTCATLPDAGAAQITSPANGGMLADSSLSLTWSAAAGATNYAVWIGSAPGGYDLSATSEGLNQSRTVTVPTDGRPVYVTLWSLMNGVYKSSASWFTTANTAPGSNKARMTSPVNGSVLGGAGVTFDWDAGVGVTHYVLWIGSSPGAYDLLASGASTALTRTVTLPTDGRKIQVTLWSLISGVYQGNSYSYTAANIAAAKAVITAPATGSVLTSASATFNWSAAVGATQYALWIGTRPGGSDVHAGAEGLSQTKTVTTLPTDGSPLYVTVWSFINGAWQGSEHLFSAWLP